MTQERIKAYEKIRKDPTEAALLHMPDCNIPVKLYIDACGDGLGPALHQVQIIDKNLQRDLHMLICQIAIQEYGGKMTIVHKEGNIYNDSDGLSMWALADVPDNTAHVALEAEPHIPIEGINITDIGLDSL
ncbi:hypothetical protein O181_088790 [Austropuccinia psidii MF-1]|uniref:Reverse transcriptase/retrotransposon-derived protein RNase H-like domain-containing protein n=1 Tax=Austropuccinia psidii MF-1 TaxID=1389203 RepID=A0A9Q3IS41_9BASI|nr:hypothetical protein [Austropuccinia psidii MF-1]